jgi:hypothetical protein
VRTSVSNPDSASFDATARAPKCAFVTAACDSQGLVNGRANLGPEPGQPNTINNSCADGTGGVYHSDESLDRLRIETMDGSPLAPGKLVRITVTGWAFSTSTDRVDLYHAADATNPVWTPIATLSPFGLGSQSMTTNFMLPTGGSQQAIRGNWRQSLAPGACTSGPFDDRDDLVFVVAAIDTTPPVTTITAPPAGSLQHATVTVTATASDNVGVTAVDLLVDGASVATDTTAPYSFPWITAGVPDGAHQLATRARDAAGNTGTSPAVSVTVDNGPPTTAITAPASGATVTGTVVVTASASDATSAVAQVAFLLDGAVQSTSSMGPYAWSWNTTGATPGSHTLVSRATDAAGNQASSAGVTVTVQAPAFTTLWPEAESGALTTPMQNLADATASGGRYITVAAGNNSQAAPPANGRATFSFSVAAAGTYKLWGRVIAPSTGDDSFWAIMDGGTAINWDLPTTTATAWTWDQVHDGSNGNALVQFTLAAGPHTLVIAYREDGAKLDRLLITNDPMLVPSGSGPPVPPPAPATSPRHPATTR